jgi:aspartate racemase
MERVGILGGLGPMAGAYFLELVTDMTEAVTDQEHINVMLLSDPDVPDRTAFLLGESEDSPLPKLKDALAFFAKSDVNTAAMACVTAHFFHGELQQSYPGNLLDMVALSAEKISALGKKKVGITATEGTVRSALFQKAFDKVGLEWTVPNEADQKIITEQIYGHIKAGMPADAEAFAGVLRRLGEEGCDAAILGCTELSVIKRDNKKIAGSPLWAEGVPFVVDAMEVLAEAAIIASGGKVKDTD